MIKLIAKNVKIFENCPAEGVFDAVFGLYLRDTLYLSHQINMWKLMKAAQV